MTPAQILRNGYQQAVACNAPQEMRELLLAAAVEAETRALMSMQSNEAERVATLEKNQN